MTTNHQERVAKLFEDESSLITELYAAVTEDEAKKLFADRVSSIVGRQDGRLQTLTNEIALRASLPELVRMVGDLLLSQQVADSKLKERARLLYAQKPIASLPLTADDQTELAENYVRMELAQRQGEIFWFGSYVHRQLEALTNIFLSKLTVQQINDDMKVSVNAEKTGSPPVLLVERLFNSTGFSIAHDNNVNNVKSGKSIVHKDFDFRATVKYFYWYYKQKNEGKPGSFFIIDNPYHLLITARNVDSHGGNSGKSRNNEERKRIETLRGNTAFYFCLFSAILNECHKIVFEIKYLTL
ncbi:hypothetical protein [Hymenobacter siberiensis]|uniref:hypothetical protein n=1 Tax=Hymenobacter siberiensis TaxID=2848396 RepID=UPI001C1E2507|nr:hypothetical protein [Hymenobacter siberiensis]